MGFKTKITSSKKLGSSEFIWYDILPLDENESDNTRFTYRGDLISGLKQLKQTIDFCKKPKSERVTVWTKVQNGECALKIRFNSQTVARGYILNILNGGYNLNHDY